MKIVRGLFNLPTFPNGCVLTFGNFDSIHLGHQQIISAVIDAARRKKLPACMMVFEPQPEEFFKPYDSPPRLTKLREKLELFNQKNMDYVFVLRFDSRLALLSAEEFLDTILIRRLRVQQVIVGEDCRFGMGHQGDVLMLKRAGAQHPFSVTVIETLFVPVVTDRFTKESDCRVSSTMIRQALSEGNLLLATQLLGRPYGMSGRVAHGDKRALQLGFPTANIYVHRKKSPLLGVYLVKILRTTCSTEFYGIANIGYRPTAKRNEDRYQKILLEVHIFDFNQNIYGQHLCIEFIHKIRDEKLFSSFEDLKVQVDQDILNAKQLLIQYKDKKFLSDK